MLIVSAYQAVKIMKYKEVGHISATLLLNSLDLAFLNIP